jgi:hypothetical protein
LAVSDATCAASASICADDLLGLCTIALPRVPSVVRPGAGFTAPLAAVATAPLPGSVLLRAGTDDADGGKLAGLSDGGVAVGPAPVGAAVRRAGDAGVAARYPADG